MLNLSVLSSACPAANLYVYLYVELPSFLTVSLNLPLVLSLYMLANMFLCRPAFLPGWLLVWLPLCQPISLPGCTSLCLFACCIFMVVSSWLCLHAFLSLCVSVCLLAFCICLLQVSFSACKHICLLPACTYICPYLQVPVLWRLLRGKSSSNFRIAEQKWRLPQLASSFWAWA